MPRLPVLVLLAVWAVLAWPAPAHAQVTSAQIEQTIRRAVDYIYSQQNEYGHWDSETPPGRQVAGVTSLATYALLTAGESYQSPKLERAIMFLKQISIEGTYATGLRNHVWGQLPQGFAPQLATDTRALVAGIGRNGSYTYMLGGDGDNSCTQYGVLGVWEGAKRNQVVPSRYWRSVEKHFIDTQNSDGGWSYSGGGGATPSTNTMTAAGLTCLYITREYLHRDAYIRPGRTDRHPLQARIDRALAHVAGAYAPNANMYYMYGVERVGLASGRKHFNGRDWYAEGAAHMVNTQTAEGQIGGGHGGPVVATSFALAFLVRGGHPVFINALAIPDYPWRNHPHAIANVTGWVSDQVERRMLWQVVEVDSPTEQWLDAPVLYLAGHEPLSFDDRTLDLPPSLEAEVRARLALIAPAEPEDPEPTRRRSSRRRTSTRRDRAAPVEAEPAEAQPTEPPLTLDDVLAVQLKRYIDLGGLLFTHADAGNAAFTRSVHALLERLYPHLEVRPIDPDDPIYRIVYKIEAESVPLEGLHNGIRYLAIHSRKDMSQYFQVNQPRNPDMWRVMANLYHYATDKGVLRARLDTHYEVRRTDIEAGSSIAVARARYDGNWDPEPAAWDCQANFMHNRCRTRVNVETVDLDQLHTAKAPFAHVTGTAAVEFTDAQVAAIQQFVNGGGVVLFDAAGGQAAFAESVQEMLRKRAFPGHPMRPIPVDHPAVRGVGVMSAFDCSTVDYQPYALLRMGKTNQPRLIGLDVKGEPRVVLSYEDMTTALLDQPVWGVFGYSGDSARRLTANLALWAAQPAVPTTQPAPASQPALTPASNAPPTTQ